MPKQTGRRRALADASITVLARDGIHGLTHRTVDATAEFPVGTTSRYFRTREALLVATAEAILDRHREYVHHLAQSLPHNRAGLIDALERLIIESCESNRELYTARFELGLEATRSKPVESIMRDLRAASLELTRHLLASAGVDGRKDHIDTLASFLTGVLFDRITLDRPHVDSRTIARLLTQVLHTELR